MGAKKKSRAGFCSHFFFQVANFAALVKFCGKGFCNANFSLPPHISSKVALSSAGPARLTNKLQIVSFQGLLNVGLPHEPQTLPAGSPAVLVTSGQLWVQKTTTQFYPVNLHNPYTFFLQTVGRRTTFSTSGRRSSRSKLSKISICPDSRWKNISVTTATSRPTQVMFCFRKHHFHVPSQHANCYVAMCYVRQEFFQEYHFFDALKYSALGTPWTFCA